ncbi:signal peptide peptidase SppA [Desulfurispira natronophila]|uniref:Protease-4 n=1 Tax=Desulfurispira natronophila TaxID=682562 RepID=A0A7W7Y2J7_9BACT|nr:signal peptide peptidase SppA [Desulfurispira natronophila]MBB5020754.1 protease-4 [Desulfurispira natronophila]
MRKFFKWFFIVTSIVIVTTMVNSAMRESKKLTEPHIGVVDLEGVIYDVDFVASALDHFANEPMVKGVLVRVNSPGGVVAPSHELYSMLRTYDKPLWAYHDGLAASGALMATLGADRIGTQSTTITGSIGVMIKAMNARELYEKIGIEEVTIKSGRFKDLLSSADDEESEERAILEELIGDSHEVFVQAILDSRPIDPQVLEGIADGRVFSGMRAVKYGLADEVSSGHEYRAKFARSQNVPESNILVYERSRGELLRQLLSQVRIALDGSAALMYIMD